MSSRFAVPSQPLSFDPRFLDDETLFGREEHANDDVLGDIIEQLDLWSDLQSPITASEFSGETDVSKVKLESSETVRGAMDPMFATTSSSPAPSEEDGGFMLPTMVARPVHNTQYLNCPLDTWTDLDIDNIPITIEDLNLPDVDIEPVTESQSPSSSGAKSNICQKSDVEEGDEGEEVNGGDADNSDEDYTPESERRAAAAPTRRRAGRPRGSTGRKGAAGSNRVKAGRVSKRTRIVQNRIDSEVLTHGQRLYEAQPFDDPVKERCRRNAINAKLNRERKAKEKEALARQMSMLRKENRRAQTEADVAERRAEEAERRAAEAEAELERLRAVLRENGLGCKTALRPHGDNYSEKMDCSACGGGN